MEQPPPEVWLPPPPAPSEKVNWWWNVAILFLVVGGVYAVFHFRPFRVTGGQNHPAVGTTLPRIELEALQPDQRPITQEDLQGQVVLICFWGPWSELSHRALPRVAEIATPYKNRPDFRFLTIVCPQQPATAPAQIRQEARSILQEWKLSVPVYVDEKGNTLATFRALVGLEQVPTLYLVDRQGKIRAVWPGYQEGVEKQVRELLAEEFPEAAVP